MVVPESYRTELNSEGGYDVFRKKYFGRLRLGNEGIDVDTAYEELSNLYPHLFPSDIINPADPNLFSSTDLREIRLVSTIFALCKRGVSLYYPPYERNTINKSTI